MTDDGRAKMAERDDPDLETIRATVEALLKAETERRKTILTELEALEEGGESRFAQTREILSQERELLAELEALLTAERTRIDELEDVSAYLQTEQAVRNREAALQRLRRHNHHLLEFHDAFATALDAVAENIATLEADPSATLPHDADPHLQAARDAIDAHNDAIEHLGRNLRILTQYMR